MSDPKPPPRRLKFSDPVIEIAPKVEPQTYWDTLQVPDRPGYIQDPGRPGIREYRPAPRSAPASKAITASCGHVVPPQKISSRPCGKCREILERERALERRASREKFPRGQSKPRLPDGAEFWSRYDATTARWTGSLTIGDLVIRTTTSGIFGMFAALDGIYREHVGKADKP